MRDNTLLVFKKATSTRTQRGLCGSQDWGSPWGVGLPEGNAILQAHALAGAKDILEDQFELYAEKTVGFDQAVVEDEGPRLESSQR